MADRTAKRAALGRGQALGRLELIACFDTGLDRLGEPDLVILGEQIVATYVLEVEANEVFVVAVFAAGLHGLYGHCIAFRIGDLGSLSARSKHRARLAPRTT